MAQYELAFLGLSEIRWPGNSDYKLNSGFSLIYSVGILLSNNVRRSEISRNPISDRIITCRNIRIRKVSLVQSYAPTEISSLQDRDDFYNLLFDTLSTILNGGIEIVIGDLNTKVGKCDRDLEHVMGNYGIGERNNNGDRFLDISNSFDLIVGGTLFPQREIHKVPWISPDKRTRNQIDHISIDKR